MKFGRPHYQPAERVRCISDWSRCQPGYSQSGQQCCCRCYQQVDFRLLAHRFSHLAGENRDEVHRERTSCASHSICGITHRRQCKQHHCRCLECITYCNGHCRTSHSLCYSTCGQTLSRHIHNFPDEHANVELAADIASRPYLLNETSISFLFRNDLNLLNTTI